MAGIVFACITPHGLPIGPALSDDAEGAIATRQAMEELGGRCASARREVLIVATPHGIRVDGTICLGAATRGVGALHWQGHQVEMNIPIDNRLTDTVAAAARAAGVPVALASMGGNRRDQSTMPLD